MVIICFLQVNGSVKLLQREKSTTTKTNSQFELPCGTILWSPFLPDAEDAEEEQRGTCPGCHPPAVALASCPSPKSCLTSLPDLDFLQFIIGSFRTLLHALSFLSMTGRCAELFTAPKDIRMSLKLT